jgi:hypothetical protein
MFMETVGMEKEGKTDANDRRTRNQSAALQPRPWAQGANTLNPMLPMAN